MNILFLIANWNDYFDGEYTSSNADTTISSSDGNLHIHEVFFTNHNSEIIHLSDDDNNKLLVSDCVFNCTKGGNIYQNKGQVVQYRVCSIRPMDSINGQVVHSLITTSQDKTSKNYLNLSTITGSDADKTPINHNYGEIIIQNVNISDSSISRANRVYTISGFSESKAFISFSTFIQNKESSSSTTYYASRCLSHGSVNAFIYYCNIISNQCQESVIYASSKPVNINMSVITGNRGENLFEASRCGIHVYSSLLTPNYCSTQLKSDFGFLSTYSITNSLNIENSFISTALCYPYIPEPYSINITLNKTIYISGEDSNITGTISFDRIKGEPFTLVIWIDNLDPEQPFHKESGSSTYEFSIRIPSTLSVGKHNFSATINNTNDNESVPIYKYIEFEYERPFHLYLDDLENINYTKTLNPNIIVRGSGNFSHGDIYINCSIGDVNSTFIGTVNNNSETYQFNFSGVCLLPDSIKEEKRYSVTVWATTNHGETTEKKSKEFNLYQPILVISNTSKETYINNVDNTIKASGYYSKLNLNNECHNISRYYFDEDPSNQTTESIITNTDINLENQSFNVDLWIPNDLSQGSNQFHVEFCCDNDRCIKSNIQTFNYSYNAPVINILKHPYFPVHINYTRNLNFTLSVTDKDKNSTISIFHIFNNTITGNNFNITLSDDQPKEIKYSIPVPNDIKAGIYPIDFYAIDEYNLTSNKISINATISYKTEDLRYFSHKIYRR